MGRDGGSSISRRRKHCSNSSSDDEDDRRIRKRSSSKLKITEEDINEYLAKKALKKAMKVAKQLKTDSGYANDSNPFGDSNLNEKFVWKKKIEKSVSQGEPIDEISVKSEKRRIKDRMAEIEKVKRRREERAIQKIQHEEEMAMLARERTRAELQDWEKKEQEFHFEQSKIRTRIRLNEGRIKPIDILSKHLDDDFELVVEEQMNEPYTVFQGKTVKDMEELREDIKMHLDLDRATPTHIEYWEALLVVCDWELAEARKRDALDRARVRGESLAEERGLHSSIEEDVKTFLLGKTYRELKVMQTEIESQMRSGTAKVVEYWEAVLKRLDIFKAKACLKEIHTNLLEKHLPRLQNHAVTRENTLEHEHPVHDMEDDAGPYSPKLIVEEEAGSFSPELVHDNEDEEAIDPVEDINELERRRQAVIEEHRRRGVQETMASKPAPVDNNLELKASKAMGDAVDGDAVFDELVNLDSQVHYWWHDKYRPRKPRYLNRVHTGYEWNKYNQTHYDYENPPPKTVQGYKFNIFYPDLVDKTKTPSYTIDPDEGSNGETCLIRFHAGPPYEDIAFKIVNKDWELSHKKGHKCTFDRGILQVYFNFKRYRYRR